MVLEVATIVAAFAAGFAGWEAGKAAHAANKSADTSERALRGLERPYMFIQVEGHFMQSGTYTKRDPKTGKVVEVRDRGLMVEPFVNITLKNYGRIAAIPISLSVDFRHLIEPPKQIVHVPDTDFEPDQVIEPQRAMDEFRCDSVAQIERLGSALRPAKASSGSTVF